MLPGRASSARVDGGEPSIDLDTMLDLTAAAEVDGVKFDGVDLFLFDPHVNIDASDDELKAAGRQGRAAQPRDRLGRGAGLAADGRRLGDGQRRRIARSFSTRSARAAASPASSASWASGRMAWCGSTRPAAWAIGLRRPRRQSASRSPTRSARPARSPRISASGWRPKAKSAGAACTVGGAWCNCWRWSIGRRRWAFRPTWPTRCLYVLGYNAPEDAILPPNFDWKDTATFDRRLRAAHRGAAALDDRLSRRPERRHRARLRLARQDRAGTACPTIPTASSTSSRWPASGCATTTGNLTKKFRHVCWDGCMFPNEVMMDPQTWNDDPGGDDRRAGRARLERISRGHWTSSY